MSLMVEEYNCQLSASRQPGPVYPFTYCGSELWKTNWDMKRHLDLWYSWKVSPILWFLPQNVNLAFHKPRIFSIWNCLTSNNSFFYIFLVILILNFYSLYSEKNSYPTEKLIDSRTYSSYTQLGPILSPITWEVYHNFRSSKDL